MLSQKTKYALKALLYLAEQDVNHISKTVEIAEAASIPKKFLEQILLDLKRGHFVGSKQGKFGGYYLLKSKNDITLADIHRLFDGAIALLPCASLNFYERCSDCVDESECLLRHGLITIREETLKAMQGITIASLVKK
ncbi:Rrf2 family transcriptional regulator [Flavobacterium sinopsychrotolerans]|jgi:Rrf2 family protein|uniref:Transcriptional regulator, BadM/Rrf2 family n=1 Tax=Flavobacterium sinopsychrotolerans TaxID=604089 RepID=A0A1H8I6N6_9FLAO|nr:Rrf2 family transcriptional regulator [Flavobacterium sinopsychrotolerans]MDD2674027.1 Rrf2 family transcriptional regulator [Flavobacterium sp.]SEN63528.1 transcriptional regulator, BadM/Rrf2 family [Flavobacterium sinopsychrotolerans]